jgi:hypothetical protein
MIPNEETTQPTEQPEQPRAARPVSTSRPRRPRPPRLRTRPPEISKITEQNIPESVPEPAAAAQQQATDIQSPDTMPKALRETAAPRPQSQSRSPALSEAIEEVTQVIGALKQTLYDLEEVLEILEDTELQKNADQREIERLRQVIRQMNQPRTESDRQQSRAPGRDMVERSDLKTDAQPGGQRQPQQPMHGRGPRGRGHRYQRPPPNRPPAQSEHAPIPTSSHRADEPGENR